jgi:hypothetical protein
MPSLNASSLEVPIAQSWHSGRIDGVNERALAFRPWVLSTLLRPVLFGVAVAAAVLAGERSGSFFVGLLAFLVASGAGRALRRLLRGRLVDAVYEALWPAAATGLAVLFTELGLVEWASAIVAIAAAGIVKNVLAAAFLPRRVRRGKWTRVEQWGVPGLDDVIEARWTKREER